MIIGGVVIKIIPHEKQRYDTPGDWRIDDDGILQIRVSWTPDWRDSTAVAIHELISASICTAQGITGEQIDKFDLEFENHRQLGDNSEPGADPRAPNHFAFKIAFAIEKIVAKAMGLNWKRHNATINALSGVRASTDR